MCDNIVMLQSSKVGMELTTNRCLVLTDMLNDVVNKMDIEKYAESDTTVSSSTSTPRGTFISPSRKISQEERVRLKRMCILINVNKVLKYVDVCISFFTNVC